MFDEVKRIGESPMPLKALVSSVMPMSTSSDSPRAKESQVAALDTFATAADPHHRSPKLCNILHHVVQVTHSPQTAYAITHLGLGIGAKRYTRPQHLPGQMTSESKDPPLPDKDTVIGTDNDGHYELHASEQTATYHPGHQPQVFSRGFTLTDASQNTGAQKEPIERKPQNAASPGLFTMTPQEEQLLERDRQVRFAKQLARALLGLGGTVGEAQGYVCHDKGCSETTVFTEPRDSCPDCTADSVRPVAEVIAHNERLLAGPAPAPERKAPTHEIHILRLQHSRQTVKQTEDWMKGLLEQSEGQPHVQHGIVLWMMLFGDVTTLEYIMKNIEKYKWEQRFIVFLGRLHEIIYQGKSVAELLVDFGGPELAALAGWRTERAITTVRALVPL